MYLGRFFIFLFKFIVFIIYVPLVVVPDRVRLCACVADRQLFPFRGSICELCEIGTVSRLTEDGWVVLFTWLGSICELCEIVTVSRLTEDGWVVLFTWLGSICELCEIGTVSRLTEDGWVVLFTWL